MSAREAAIAAARKAWTDAANAANIRHDEACRYAASEWRAATQGAREAYAEAIAAINREHPKETQ